MRVEDGKLVAERPILQDSQVSDVHYRSERRRDHRPPQRVRGDGDRLRPGDGRGRRRSSTPPHSLKATMVERGEQRGADVNIEDADYIQGAVTP